MRDTSHRDKGKEAVVLAAMFLGQWVYGSRSPAWPG